jgi:F-type H+-transporting ATPase subunit delta
MSKRITASRYARALFETALEKDVMETVDSDISKINKILNEIPKIKKYCREYHTEKQEEIEFIKTAFIPYISALTEKLLFTAVKNGRLSSIPLIPAAFMEISDLYYKRINITLESAKEPDESLIKKITVKMEKRTNRKILITKTVKPELIGGFRIIWKNRILDMSVLGRIKKMHELLTTA